MTSSLAGRRREVLILGSGPVLGAAVGAVTNLITSTWSWGLFVALLALISLAAGVAALVPGNGSGGADPVRGNPPSTLPPGAAVFAGRDQELRRLLDSRPPVGGSRPLVCIITGRSGSGKTELAVQAAHLLAERYPAGRLFVGYRSHADSAGRLDPRDVLATLLIAVGAARTPAHAGLAGMSGQWRSLVGHQPFLIVLDDVDHVSQVLDVLPASPHSLVLLTSRQIVPGVDADVHIEVDTLTEEAARSVLTGILRRGARSIDDSVIDGLVAMYRLPLTVRHIADRIIAEQAPLGPLTRQGRAHRGVGLEPMLATVQALAPTDRLVFHRAVLHPGPHVTAEIGAALAHITPAEAARALAVLHHHGLLMRPDPHGYSFHDLLRSLAQPEGTFRSDDTSRQAHERLFGLAASLLARANAFIAAPIDLRVPDSPSAGTAVPMTETQALEWLRHNFDDLRSVARLAIDRAWPKSWYLTSGLAYFMRIQRNLAQAEELNESALQIALGSGDREGQAHCHAHLGTLHRVSGRYPSAREHSRTAMRIFADLRPRELRNHAYCAGELAVIFYHLAEYEPAREMARQAVDGYRDTGDRRGEANGLGVLGMISRAAGDYGRARDFLTDAHAIFEDIRSVRNKAWMLIELGTIDRLTGDQHRALMRYSEALAIYTDAADRNGCAWARREMGIVRRSLGHYTEAGGLLEAAWREFSDLGMSRNEADARVELCSLHRSMGDLAAARSHAQAARDTYTGMGNRRGEAWTELELGALDVTEDRLESAAVRFERARVIHEGIGDRSGGARVQLELGRLALAKGEDRAGRLHLEAAVSAYTALGAPQAAEARALLDGT